MIIVSVANHEYKERLLFSMEQSRKFGYDIVPYDVGHLGFGKKYEIEKKLKQLTMLRAKAHICLSKPTILLDAWDSADETIVFLDADAFLIDNIDEIDTDDYDVGVTYKGGDHNPVINSGVLFLRQTSNTRKFLELWLNRINKVEEVIENYPKSRKRPAHFIGDQFFLNQLIFSYVKKGGEFKNTVQDICGVRVKFFDYKIYNNFRASNNKADSLKGIKILHFYNKRGTRWDKEIERWGL